MYTRKPYLLEIRPRLGQVLPEEGAPFINGDRMADGAHLAQFIGIRQTSPCAKRIQDAPYRAHCVPYTQKMWLAIVTTKCFFKPLRGPELVGRHREDMQLAEKTLVISLEQADRVRNQSFISWTKQPKHFNEPAESACGIGSAAESEDENLVTGFKGPHEVLICVGNVFRYAIAECQAPDPGPGFSSRRKGIFRAHGSDSRMVVRDLSV